MVIVLVSGFFKRRCFCNVCPLGFILGLTHRISLFKLKKNAVACTECGACYEGCPMGIKSIFTEREGKDIRKIDVTTSGASCAANVCAAAPKTTRWRSPFAARRYTTPTV